MTFSHIFRRTLSKYNNTLQSFNDKTVNDLIYNEKKHIVAIFKEHLIFNESCDFFCCFYPFLESLNILIKICWSEKNSKFTPCYASFSQQEIMLKYRCRKHKIAPLLELELKTTRFQPPNEQNEKLINSSMIAESLAISQNSGRALFLHDKDKITKGCLDFMDKSEIIQLFTDDQMQVIKKHMRNPVISKKKRNPTILSCIMGINNKTTSNKTTNPTLQSTRRNKSQTSSQGIQFKSFRKSSLTTDNTNENEPFINYNTLLKGINEKKMHISLKYEKKLHNKLSILNNNNCSTLNKAVRNLKELLKKRKTLTKNDTLESLSMNQKEQLLLQTRIRKHHSPYSNNQKTGTNDNFSANSINKKNCKIDTVSTTQSSHNPNHKHYSSMMRLQNKIKKHYGITALNSTATSRANRVNYNNRYMTSNDTKSSRKQFNLPTMAVKVKNKNSAIIKKDIFMSLSKEKQSFDKNNHPQYKTNKFQNKPRNHLNSNVVTIQKNQKYTFINSNRKSNMLNFTHVKSSLSFSKKTDSKVLCKVIATNFNSLVKSKNINVNGQKIHQPDIKSSFQNFVKKH